MTVGGTASGTSAQAFFMAARGLLLLLTSHGRHQAVAVQFGRPRARAALLYVANCRVFQKENKTKHLITTIKVTDAHVKSSSLQAARGLIPNSKLDDDSII